MTRANTLLPRLLLVTGLAVLLSAASASGQVIDPNLQSLLDDLPGRSVVLVNLLVPRSWEAHNNGLFARLAQDNANVAVIDWNSVGRANPSWLYDDRIHLVAPGGREGYARWLIKAVTT